MNWVRKNSIPSLWGNALEDGEWSLEAVESSLKGESTTASLKHEKTLSSA